MLNGVDGGANDEHLLNGNASDISFADGVLGGAHGIFWGRNVNSNNDNDEIVGLMGGGCSDKQPAPVP